MTAALALYNDFETTGLDLTKDVPLEAYFDLRLMDPANGVVYKNLFTQHAYIDSHYDRASLNPKVEEMHTKNGLWYDLAANADNLVSISALDSVIAAALRSIQSEYKGATIHLAGMGVANYDKRLIERDMPLTNALLHYRTADVSVTRMVLEFGGWQAPDDEAFFGSVHRVKEDVEQGIAQASYITELVVSANAKSVTT